MRFNRTPRDERGAALVFVAISIVAMLSIAAIVIDGGQGYASHRQMQNSADAAALAGARALQLARFDTATCPASLPSNDNCNPQTAVTSVASRNQADSSQCYLITAVEARGTGPLPQTHPCSSAATRAALAPYVGVFVKTAKTDSTVFAKIVNRSSLATSAQAAATVQRFKSNNGPWMVCGSSAIGGYDFLTTDPVTGNSVLRPDAELRRDYGGPPEQPVDGGLLLSPQSDIGGEKAFPVHGKLDKNCGLSNNWKGLIEPDALPVTVPEDDVPAENGKKVGQYKYKDILSGSSYGDGTEGCPDADNQVNYPNKGQDDFGETFQNCLVPVPVFDTVTDAKGPNERVHLAAIVCLRIIPSHTSTIKYYGQFVRGSTCTASAGPTSDDITPGGLMVVKLVR